MADTTPVFGGRGQRHRGELVADLPPLQGWSWPYVTITGERDGPLATIIAGVHGCEYVSIRAAVRLAREIAPGEVRGRILIVPIVNLPSFRERTPFVCPIDGKNPNRVFPGRADGTFSEALAHFTFTTCIAPSETLLDLHGGDLVEELLPFAIYAANADEATVARSRALADAFGLPYSIGQGAAPGVRSGMTYAAAAERGIPAIIAEAGGIGQLTEPDVETLVAGSRRALQAAGVLDTASAGGELHSALPVQAGTTHLARFDWLYSTAGGFWIADVRAGDEVRAGQRLGQILDPFGEPLETIEAPSDGIVIFRTTSAAVAEQGLLLALGA